MGRGPNSPASAERWKRAVGSRPGISGKQPAQRQESRSNIMGKFTTSVKKFVQDVESDQTRDGCVQNHERLRLCNARVHDCYSIIKKSLTTLHAKYEESKEEKNVLRRYALFKTMIKAVIKLDTQYWILIEIPKQEKQEPAATYVMRCCTVIEKAVDARLDGKTSSLKQAEEEERIREKRRLDEMSIPEIFEENNENTNDLYAFIKKYNNARDTVRNLKVSYMDAKLYPFLPRYIMLKDMVKGVLRHPVYMEICQEDFMAAA
ncbi:hypothetical protein HDE_07534 [Halotydeus destructor]|nr:hypothetical protein HDE_07534 [Halotydeus destructor]